MNKDASGPPGKFYKEQHALIMLDTLKVTDSYARLGLDNNPDDAQKRHFDRFLAKLQAGDLVRSRPHFR